MKLNKAILDNQDFLAINQIKQPLFNIEEVKKNTKERPTYLHFGAGNIFKVFLARRYQELLNHNLIDTGIISVETYDDEIVDLVNNKTDNLNLAVLMAEDGSLDLSIVASIVASLKASSQYQEIKEIFTKESLQIVSYTITEKAYQITDSNGKLLKIIEEDLKRKDNQLQHVMSITCSLLYHRFKSCNKALTILSLDNCSHNGDKIKKAILSIANIWLKESRVSSEFISYLENKVTFPISMIDKITPRPSKLVQKKLEAIGFKQLDLITTSKNSFVAPFVNAEVSEYLVIEDKFANGRCPLEKVGVLFTDYQTVNDVETMKVTTCLNPLHTAMAVVGCLLNYKTISDETNDPTIMNLIKTIGYKEGLPVVCDPKIINPKDFIDEVINKRLTNPNIPDTPQRIATDTSMKIAIRFGNTIKSYQRLGLDLNSLEGIPLAIAAWFRYLVAIDDFNNHFELSSDIMAQEIIDNFKNIKIGDVKSITHLLSNPEIMGLDLTQTPLADKINLYFNMMLKEEGGVRKTIDLVLKC